MPNQIYFGSLFKKYRLCSEFETLKNLAEALRSRGYVYDESLYSHWQKGRRIPNRRTLLILASVFMKRHGIRSENEVNEFLEAAGQGYLTKKEQYKLRIL